MLQNFRNIYFTINNSSIIASSLELTSDVQVDAYYDNDDYTTNKFNTNGPQVSSLKFNYFLTGVDPIYNYLESKTGTLSGNFGGYYFNSGYLKSYGFDLSPNNGISISAEINFFDTISGSFTNQSNNLSSIYDILDSSNVSFSNADGINLNNENILGLRLNFNNEIVPSYSNISIYPQKVFISKKMISCEIDTDSEKVSIPYSGQNIGFNFVVKDQNNTSIHSFNITGKIVGKSLRVSSNNPIINTFKIVQPTLFNNVLISGYSPTSGRYGDLISISGLNMEKVSAFYFYDTVQSIFSFDGINKVTAQVPIGTISGELGVYDLSNVKYRAGDFNVIDDGISITGFTPVSGGYYASF